MSTYVYGITASSHPALPEGMGGVGDPARAVRILKEGELAAIVSEAPEGLRPKRRDLLAHQSVLSEAGAGGSLLPMRFGSVAPDDASVVGVLAERAEHYAERLRALGGKVEYNVKASHDEQAVLHRVMGENPELRAFTEANRQAGGGSYEDRLRLGERGTMNRLGLGLAIGAGYVLGRTKKMKLAFAVGTLVAGKRMQLSPRALADLVSQQLQNNPQFKEIGDRLREDLRGVGKAATGALVERQSEGLAGWLHGRTSLGSAAGGATRGATGATDRAKDATKSNPLTDVVHSAAVDHLKGEAREYLAAQVQRLLVGAGRKLGETTVKLNDVAEGNSPGFAKLALDGGRKLAEGKGPLRTALEVGAGRAKDNVLGAVKSLGGGKGKRKGGSGDKPTVIIESIDVGVPLRTAYDQWTQFQSFSTFAKGVKSANRADDSHSDWQLKVFWSNRSWKAHTIEQVPDGRITWTSEGAKGSTKGAVSFHHLADNLTRILLVLEYYPKGLFEKTGNIWRAQGRRARLDLKNFARFITLRGEAEDGWRGEIRDGEVVVTHEDALAEEERAEREELDEREGRRDGAPEDDEAEAEYAEEEPEPDEEPRDSDGTDEADEPDGYADEEDEGDAEDVEDVPEDEYEEVPEAEGDAGEDIDEEPYEDEDEEPATVGGSRR